MSAIAAVQANAFIINAHKRCYSGLFKKEPSISFFEYVKSQLDFNIVTPLFSRSIIPYNEAMKFITTQDTRFLDSFCQVLRWYYIDLSSAIFNCIDTVPDGFVMITEPIPCREILAKSDIKVIEVYTDLCKILHGDRISTPKFDYFSYLEYIPLNSRLALKPTMALAQAITVRYLADCKTLKYLEV